MKGREKGETKSYLDEKHQFKELLGHTYNGWRSMIAADLLLTSRWHLMMMMRRNNEQLLGDKKRGTDLVTRFKFAFAAGRLTST